MTTNRDSFFAKVYDIVLKVPYGRVTTYGAIANYLGSKGAARMVGWAMNASHRQITQIPAHRVVNRRGMLTGKHHFETPALMQKLLENEGVEVKDDQIINFKNHFWDPSLELD